MKAIARLGLIWGLLAMLTLPVVLHAKYIVVTNNGTVSISGYTESIDSDWMSESPVGLMISNSMLFFAALLPLFFWVRGVSRGSKGDCAAATVLLLVVSFFMLAVGGNSGGVAGIGLVVMLMGGGTFIGGASAESACFRKRSDRIALGILFCALGILLMSVL